MAVKWTADIWSPNTVFVKSCPFQPLPSTYPTCFRKCKLHQQWELPVVFPQGEYFLKDSVTLRLDKVALRICWICISTNNLSCLLFTDRRSLSEQFWQQISPTTQKQGVGTTSTCETHLWLLPMPARSLFAISPCPSIDPEQLCISLSLSARRKVDVCLPEEHINVNLKWLREYLFVSHTGKGEGCLLTCSSTVKYGLSVWMKNAENVLSFYCTNEVLWHVPCGDSPFPFLSSLPWRGGGQCWDALFCFPQDPTSRSESQLRLSSGPC